VIAQDVARRASSIEEIEAAENGLPRSFMMPRRASSAEISLSDLWPPLGRLRRNWRTRATKEAEDASAQPLERPLGYPERRRDDLLAM
jgi:hypothetical protein